MRVAIKEREKDGEWFLDAEKAEEGPFTVELHNVLVVADAAGGDGALAFVVAVFRAGPEKKAEVEGERGGGGRTFRFDAGLRELERVGETGGGKNFDASSEDKEVVAFGGARGGDGED